MAMPVALVVEPDGHVRELICNVLCQAQIDALPAGNAADALAILRSQPISLLVTELRLPDRDGISFIAEVQRLCGDETSTIIVTGDQRAESIVQALRLDVRDYVFKPATPQKLLAALERASGRQQPNRVNQLGEPQDCGTLAQPQVDVAKENCVTVTIPLGGNLRAIERRLVNEVIWRCDGNKAAAARALGMHRRTLYRLLANQDP